MRVLIERKVTTVGVFRRTTLYQVFLTLEFSHEERAIIHQAGLAEYSFFQQRPFSDLAHEPLIEWNVRIQRMLKGKPVEMARCNTNAAANHEEARVRDAIAKLKAAIDNHAAPPTSTDTYDL